MKVFVTGGAGFIGSVVCERLIEENHQVLAYDNLKTGHKAALHPNAEFVEGDLLDKDLLRKSINYAKPDAVVHLAAEAAVDESVRDPALFYDVNVTGSINLLECMVEAGVKRIVFSSSAAVYGEPKRVPITEEDPCEPMNPYGETKLLFERALHWFHGAHGINHVSLRYFNACGATVRYGEDRHKESHIIPILFDVALGKRPQFNLFGTDYPTKDGTCVRDYVHVADIADAHILAILKLDSLKEASFNIGSGSGYTNLEVVEAVKKVSGKSIKVNPTGRREGDPAQLMASNDKAKRCLGWKPRFADIETMVRTAWDWKMAHPNGYSA